MNAAAARKKALLTLILCAIFIALSYALANVKIFGTIAFDALPAFLAALILGPRYGAAVGALGHLFTSLLSGFPFTLPVHLLVALMMAVCVFVFGVVYGKVAPRHRLLACLASGAAAVAINGPACILVLSPLLGPMLGGRAGLLAFLAILTAAAAANVALALVLHELLTKRIDLSRRIG